MLFLVKVRVNVEKIREFGNRLFNGELDRSLIRGETHCLADDPAVGYSVWESEDRERFESAFCAWKNYYTESSARELIGPNEAMKLLMKN